MMSGKKDTAIRFKGILKKAPIKHSTPEEESLTLSRNRLSLNSSAFLSPVPKKSFESTQPFEDGPQLTKAQTSWSMLQRKLSTGFSLDSDTTNSFQFMFTRRQLSTITGSEESNEAPGQEDVPSVAPKKRTRDSIELPTAIIGSEVSSEAPGQMVFPSETPTKGIRDSIELPTAIIGSEVSSEALGQMVFPSEMPSKRARDSSELPSKNWEGSTRWASALKISTAKKRKKPNKKLVEKRVRAWVLRQLKNIEEATTHELTIEEV